MITGHSNCLRHALDLLNTGVLRSTAFGLEGQPDLEPDAIPAIDSNPDRITFFFVIGLESSSKLEQARAFRILLSKNQSCRWFEHDNSAVVICNSSDRTPIATVLEMI